MCGDLWALFNLLQLLFASTLNILAQNTIISHLDLYNSFFLTSLNTTSPKYSPPSSWIVH